MSILIKGMAMPKNCEECPCFDEEFYYCNAKKENLSERLFDHTKDPPPNGCPLIELPPHGDLIDRDALPMSRVEWEDIVNAPTIIEAEEAEKPTNADRIRMMSDEELAEIISSLGNCDTCYLYLNKGCNINTSCKDAVFEWLKKEVDE